MALLCTLTNIVAGMVALHVHRKHSRLKSNLHGG